MAAADLGAGGALCEEAKGRDGERRAAGGGVCSTLGGWPAGFVWSIAATCSSTLSLKALGPVRRPRRRSPSTPLPTAATLTLPSSLQGV